MPATQPVSIFEWSDVGGIAVVHFTVKVLRDLSIIRDFFDALDHIVASGRPRLVINFAGLQVFASYAIGKLITLEDRLTQQGGRLVMSDLTPVIDEIVDIMQLRRRFTIVKTEREALESFV
jgi:anti-anti-sigma regulatory factor